MHYKRKIIFVCTIVLLGLIIPNPAIQSVRTSIKSLLVPVLRPLYQSSEGLRKFGLTIKGLRTLPQENEQLSAEVARLLAENSRLKEVDHENALLRDEIKFTQTVGAREVRAARIVSRSALSFLDSVTVDKGENDGLKAGQAVTSSGVFVGRVVSVAKHASDIELITGSNAITQAQLQNSRATGIVRGGLHGLVLENIPQDIPIIEGELVVTSGLGGGARAGLTIGTVLHVISKKNDIFQSATLKPAVNISRADIVFVEVP